MKNSLFLSALAAALFMSVVVSSAQVPDPVAVRYGWAGNPAVNLYNQEGFPAEPFRTDDWPYVPTPAAPLKW